MKATPSPISTGAGGSTFEHKVQTEFVCLMISNGKVCIERFEEGYTIDNISFQARYKGVQTDDMLLTFKPNEGVTSKIFAQMKNTIRLSDYNLFREVIKGFWDDFDNPAIFNRHNDVFAIIMGRPTNVSTFTNITQLLDWARTSSDYNDFLLKIKAYKQMSDSFNMLKTVTEAAKADSLSDNELWEFLKCLYLIDYDYNSDTSRDKRNIIQQLENASRKVGGAESGASVWNKLFAMVTDSNFKAGTITTDFVFRKYPSLIAWFDRTIININPVKYKLDNYRIGMSRTIASSSSIIDEDIRTMLLDSMEEVYQKLITLGIEELKGFLEKYQHPRDSTSNLNISGIGELFEILTYINCKIKDWSLKSLETANLKLIEKGKSGWVQLIYSTTKYTFPMIIMDLGKKLYDKTPNNNYFDNRWIIENANMDSDNENLCEMCGIGSKYPFNKILNDFGRINNIEVFESVPGNGNNYSELGYIKICCAKCIRKLRDSDNVKLLYNRLGGVLFGD
ncbi:ABC-three component system protein [Terribacillus sp. DMT04]|uniref:ABC-three component system protein n=1 Tax=Terribacillus sp. DMT04 TaxID=2850441 RepID=UPI001C2BED52|nr:ABC-three component system protein [Terribacillus sp. DMT04]QXE01483.1 hypothetical protein KS242_16120 [Terribacillus sp. DMT04]